MAASAWAQFVTYTEDPSAALRAARDAAFASGAYRLPFDDCNQADPATLNAAAPKVADLKKMLQIAKGLDKAFAEIGADTSESEKNTADVERFVNKVEKDGFAAACSAAGSETPTPTTIDHLLEIVAEAGTHCILDIDRIADAPTPGAATPLSDAQLQALFQTTQPTLNMAQRANQSGAIQELCQRWQAVFLLVYTDGQPTHFLFVGVSGD